MQASWHWECILSTCYSFLPHFVASVDIFWVADIYKAPHICPNGTFDIYDTVLPFLPRGPGDDGSTLFKEKWCVVSFLEGLASSLCGNVRWNGYANQGQKYLAISREEIWLNTADGLHGLQQNCAGPHCLSNYGRDGWPSSSFSNMRDARSSWQAHGISWHEDENSVRILDVYVTRWRRFTGWEERNTL